MSSGASTTRKAFVVIACVVFILSLILAYLNTAGVSIYRSTNGDVDRKYFQQASPAGIAFGIVWPIIYMWNLVAIVYLVASLFLPTNKSPVNVDPTLVTYPFLAAYILAWSSTVAWLFAFDNEILGLSFVILILAAGSIYVALGVSCTVVRQNVLLLEANCKVMLWLVRIFLQNGLGLPATWLTIATLLNLADVMIYEDSINSTTAIQRGTVSIEDGSTAALSLLWVIVVAWFILENFVWEKYFRYLFTIYPVVILALSGLIGRLRFVEGANRNLVLASVELGFACVVLLVRVGLSIYRYKTKPVLV
ncbi:uncharacterized protein LOC143460393 [Clavelina lepadiformis]|uniref:uncharacterized protein LOC143460393 n=1 Tax=Clavelina lepadiformis TaxID=159417 RepID=UPI0040426221